MIREPLADRDRNTVRFQRGEELVGVSNPRESQNRLAGKLGDGLGGGMQVTVEDRRPAPSSDLQCGLRGMTCRAHHKNRIDVVELGLEGGAQRSGWKRAPVADTATPIDDRYGKV